MSIRDKLISGPLGFGSAPLGNMFRNIPEAEAADTVDAAWRQGGCGQRMSRRGSNAARHLSAE
jgi:hypothetical protein